MLVCRASQTAGDFCYHLKSRTMQRLRRENQCPWCGAEVSHGAGFCARCGHSVLPSEEQMRAAVAANDRPSSVASSATSAPQFSPEHETERIIFTTRPTLLFISMGYLVALVASFLTMIACASLGVRAFVSLPLALFFLLFPALFHMRRNSVRYTLTDARMEIARGLLMRTTRNIPLRSIQDVTVSSALLKRLFGLGDLIIENASDQGGLTVLSDLHRPRRYADLFLRELRRR